MGGSYLGGGGFFLGGGFIFFDINKICDKKYVRLKELKMFSYKIACYNLWNLVSSDFTCSDLLMRYTVIGVGLLKFDTVPALNTRWSYLCRLINAGS